MRNEKQPHIFMVKNELKKHLFFRKIHILYDRKEPPAWEKVLS